MGRPQVGSELADLVRTIALANPLWGAPRIHGELLKLGLDVSQRTVARLMPRHPKPPSQTWRTFLQNHVADLVSVDFLRRTDGDLPRALRVRGPSATSPSGRALSTSMMWLAPQGQSSAKATWVTSGSDGGDALSQSSIRAQGA